MPASARSSESIVAAHFESDGQRRSEQFRRSDLKDESQPLISNLTTLCHPPGKPSRSPFRKPAQSTPPSGALSEDDTCPRVLNERTFFRMSCECATRPGAQAETLSGRLSDHSPSAFRTRHLFPSTPADKTLRKPPELATRSECLDSKLTPGALRVATCPETHPRESRIPPAIPEC